MSAAATGLAGSYQRALPRDGLIGGASKEVVIDVPTAVLLYGRGTHHSTNAEKDAGTRVNRDVGVRGGHRCLDCGLHTAVAIC